MIRVAINDSRYIVHNSVNIDDRLWFLFFFPQAVWRKENVICEIVSIESTGGNSILEIKWVLRNNV